MFKAILAGIVVVIGYFLMTVSAKAQWYPYYGGYAPPVAVGPPFVVGPPVVVAPPPVVVAPPPVVVAPPPPPPPVVIVNPPPPPPPAPVVVVEKPQRKYYWVNGRRCWMQYAGLDNWGQRMYIQACE